MKWEKMDIILIIGILAVLLFGFIQLHKYLTKGGTLPELFATLTVFVIAFGLAGTLINKKRQQK